MNESKGELYNEIRHKYFIGEITKEEVMSYTEQFSEEELSYIILDGDDFING